MTEDDEVALKLTGDGETKLHYAARDFLEPWRRPAGGGRSPGQETISHEPALKGWPSGLSPAWPQFAANPGVPRSAQ
jgi:hypothetical protein